MKEQIEKEQKKLEALWAESATIDKRIYCVTSMYTIRPLDLIFQK